MALQLVFCGMFCGFAQPEHWQVGAETAPPIPLHASSAVLAFRDSSSMNTHALDSILSHYHGETYGIPPQPADWARAEQELGREIPQDYKTLLNQTGAHSLGHCFLRSPTENERISLSRAELTREELIFGEMAKEMLDLDFYPEIGGWIQLAYCDREFFMLPPTGDEIMLVSLSLWKVHETKLTFTELIWSLYEDRTLYDNLGASIWFKGRPLFGLT